MDDDDRQHFGRSREIYDDRLFFFSPSQQSVSRETSTRQGYEVYGLDAIGELLLLLL